MKKALLIAGLATCSLTIAQNVNIPDANFKAMLVGNTNINTNSDSEIQVSEANAFTGVISCGWSNISDLTGLETFVNATELWVNDNNISSIDISNNPNLITVYCQNNQISSLDLSSLSSLQYIQVQNNQLTDLNVANGNNSNVLVFNATGNTNLSCVTVDDVSYSTTNWTNVDAGTSFSTNCPACVVNIPDANFKSYLLGSTSINTNSDSEIQCSEAAAYTGSIICNSAGIADMTGIEQFTQLATLQCSDNSITTLDLSNNTSLSNISCYNNDLTSINLTGLTSLTNLTLSGNSLTSIDLSTCTALAHAFLESNDLTSLDITQNTALIYIRCYGNNLTAIDVSQNTALTYLDCGINDITSLDVSVNTNLLQLHCSNNLLTSLDVSTLTNLTTLACQSNNLSSIDVSSNLLLESLTCGSNPLTSVDVTVNTALLGFSCQSSNITTLDVSNNLLLQKIWFHNNQITGSVDLSNHTDLIVVNAANNQITNLNVANGNNSNFLAFWADANSNLNCISVDDVAYSTTNWTNVDAGTSFSTDCSVISGIDEIVEEVKLYPNPATDIVNLSTVDNIEQIKVIDIQGAVVLKSNRNKFSVAQLPSGFYVVQVNTNNGIYQKELIVE